MNAGELKELRNCLHNYNVKLLAKLSVRATKGAGVEVSTVSRLAQA